MAQQAVGIGRKGNRVLRGGSWNNNQDNARCSYRNNNDPDNRNNNIGFRVVCVTTFLPRPEIRPGYGLVVAATLESWRGLFLATGSWASRWANIEAARFLW